MSIDVKKIEVSSTLTNLIAEVNFSIESVKEKILKAYHYAIEVDGHTPEIAGIILRERLFFSKRYIREVLPLEAKQQTMIRDQQGESKKKKNKNTTSKPKEEEEEEQQISELEAFRQQKGTPVAPAADVDEDIQLPQTTTTTTAEEQEEQEIIYDQPEKIIKQYEEKIAYLAKPFTRKISIEYKTQILPLIGIVDPDSKEIVIEWDKEEMKKLRV